jgi:hypothetical protein
VGEAAEGDVGQRTGLSLDRVDEVGVLVVVRRRPS